MTLLDKCVAVYGKTYAQAATDGHALPEIRRIAIAAVIDVVTEYNAESDDWYSHPALTAEQRNPTLR